MLSSDRAQSKPSRRSFLSVMPPSLAQKGVKPVAQLFGMEANAVPNAKSWQFAAFDQSVDGGATEPQQSCHLRHPEQFIPADV